ncbi:glycoside hydrolase family 127 protein [Phytoactinopolyspora halotolerans]|uniref:Glycoside hydrolase family 127 protein n=1 Tax=Phytoactinopolyspora halotolerans TaxID=1981512 RepID=A0A6L9SE03_9ACTN|nr:beta-L-arabinofuranosidase domain-containing protein [Phytoactinopolyspora halotolerans]NEE02731.1 glycoside hydrolase family 127 protein [Phytoactinopolyspora halotolerans]
MTVQETATGTDATGGRPVIPTRGRQRPLGLHEVQLDSGFWATRQATNAAATFDHCESWMERLGWLANFDRVASGTTGRDRPGWSFSDSEVYKLIEAMCWEFGRTGDPALDAAIRRLTERIGRAQDGDGYLNTCFGHANQPPRYSDLEEGHELYNTGHLLQAAVARLRTSGPDELVEIARRAADHVCETFGAGGLQGICGHPEIELGLAEFGRALGDGRYLDQARLFLGRRGHGTLRDIPLGRAYFQDDVPIRDADVLRGHAVRALYLTAAAVDVAVEDDDRELLETIERQWERTVARRTYLTGGMGSRHQDEGFGEDWELPSDRAYSETCAGIASIMLSWRLYLATGNVRYADLIERTYANVVATSPNADGRAFFYANPLHQRTAGNVPDDGAVSPRAESGARAPWFDVSCCPTNVARALATWHCYAAAAADGELTLLQYTGMRINADIGDGRRLGVAVQTAYPDDGLVTVRVLEAPADAVTLKLRVPSWADGAVVEENGARRVVEPGFVALHRAFTSGDEITLRLPIAPRFTWPDPRVDAVRGCVAVERGPLVYCAESVDLPDGIGLDDVVVDTAVEPVDRDGRVVLHGIRRGAAEPGPAWPYGSARAQGIGAGQSAATATDRRAAVPTGQAPAIELVLGPYHQWAERGPTAMRVWLPTRQ